MALSAELYTTIMKTIHQHVQQMKRVRLGWIHMLGIDEQCDRMPMTTGKHRRICCTPRCIVNGERIAIPCDSCRQRYERRAAGENRREARQVGDVAINEPSRVNVGRDAVQRIYAWHRLLSRPRRPGWMRRGVIRGL